MDKHNRATRGERVSDQLAPTSSQIRRALEWTRELIAKARRMRGIHQSIPVDSHTAPDWPEPSSNDRQIAWRLGDESVRCEVIRHSADMHEVIIIVLGEVMFSRTLADPDEAADEAERRRKLFID